jgi:hypothetical protein
MGASPVRKPLAWAGKRSGTSERERERERERESEPGMDG